MQSDETKLETLAQLHTRYAAEDYSRADAYLAIDMPAEAIEALRQAWLNEDRAAFWEELGL